LMNTYNGTKERIQIAIDKYVKDKPNSMVTPFVLNVTSQFYDDPLLLEKRLNQLDVSVRNSEIGKELAQLIAIQKIGAIGTQSIDFTQPDTIGKPVSLSSFLGKYVLVDFWASWCGPCRNENPNLVESFNKFKDKNFTVLGVSLDRPGQKDKWIEAIHHDSLSWSHVSDLKFWDNGAAKVYNISQIPQNLLIDPTGKIVGKNLRGLDLQTKLCELLGGCN
ncbi:MAG: TlpA family protein disulfide reductase, partial [Bacteroidia bacterium]|nr:TlpA family protein disulfide reductase [Bacteroidia bacterium]